MTVVESDRRLRTDAIQHIQDIIKACNGDGRSYRSALNLWLLQLLREEVHENEKDNGCIPRAEIKCRGDT